MLTFHIVGFSPEDKLLKILYDNFLKYDDSWHFVYWANGWTHKAFIKGKNIILRVSSKWVQNKVRNYLTRSGIIFEEYEFPFPRGKYQLGIKRLSWEAKNLDIMLPMLHSISLAFIKWGTGWKYKRFLHHYWHICMNVGQYNHAEEMKEMAVQLYRSSEVVIDWYKRKK
jgi:hypothetical protein